jgi:branched-chain amino acid transport system permease protein
MFSMGHAGFMAIGAYVSAILTRNFHLPIPIGILCGMLAAALAGIALSFPTMKLKDDYFIIVTLGIGESIKLIIQNLPQFTGGARGFPDIPAGSRPYEVWGVVIVIVVLLYNFINSKHGRNCVAVREETMASETIGINNFNYKMLAMAISSALCGISGAFLAHYMHFLQPNMFTIMKSDELIITVILGGRGSLAGTFISTVIMYALPEILRFGAVQEWRMVFYGLLMVFVIMFRPSGLMGGWDFSWMKMNASMKKLFKGNSTKEDE